LTARFFCDRKRVVCDLSHFSCVRRCVFNARSTRATSARASVP
jgi:hypothetical protein